MKLRPLHKWAMEAGVAALSLTVGAALFSHCSLTLRTFTL